MSAVPRAYAYFRVIGETLPFDQITEAMGVDPTEAWNKGDRGTYVQSRPNSGWCLHSPLPQSNTNLGEHVEAVMRLLQEREPTVIELSRKFKTHLVCVGWYNETASPGLFFPKGTVERIARMGMAIDADLYFAGGPVAL